MQKQSISLELLINLPYKLDNRYLIYFHLNIQSYSIPRSDQKGISLWYKHFSQLKGVKKEIYLMEMFIDLTSVFPKNFTPLYIKVTRIKETMTNSRSPWWF